jgi:Domain of unknown function (DUF4352)
MRRLLAAAVLAVTLVGCVVPNPTESAETTRRRKGGKAGQPSAPRTAPSPARDLAEIGQWWELHGMDPNLVMRVTLVQGSDPAPPKDAFFAPGKDARFVALQIRLENVGSVMYSDSPGNGAVIVDADGQQFSESLGAGTTLGPTFGAGVRVPPGGSALGYLVFELPKSAKPAVFQFTLDSGFGPETGEWDLT